MAQRIDGKLISEQVRAEIAAETAAWVEKTGVRPGLAVVIVGSDPASCVYVRNKERACAQVDFYSEKYELPEETTQEELLALVKKRRGSTNKDNAKLTGQIRSLIEKWRS